MSGVAFAGGVVALDPTTSADATTLFGTTITASTKFLAPAGSAGAPSYAFTSAATGGIFDATSGITGLVGANSAALYCGVTQVLTTTSTSVQALKPFTKVGNITTTGAVGTPAIVAVGRLTAQAAAQASVSTFTVGATDASFEVSSNVLVTTATTHSFSVTVSYTDEGNTARVLTLPFTNLAGTFSTLIVNTGGAIPYESPTFHIRCKAATAITIGTTGTFTTVAYNVEGIIKQTN